MMITFRTLGCLAALAFLAAGTLAAQENMGRRGYEWQTEQALEQEAAKDLMAKLERSPLEVWKATSLAWLELAEAATETMEITNSFHVEGIDAGEAEVRELGADTQRWSIPLGGKPPKKITIMLTDVNQTRVDCAFRSPLAQGARFLGIFQLGSALHCLPRFETQG